MLYRPTFGQTRALRVERGVVRLTGVQASSMVTISMHGGTGFVTLAGEQTLVMYCSS